MVVRESYLKKIRPFMGTELIKVLTGIRRSGKSVLLKQIEQEVLRQGVPEQNIIRYNFEQMVNAPLCSANSLYEDIRSKILGIQGKAYLFLDEIQEVDSWEKCINSCRVDFDCDIYITGSNAKLLSSELSSYLAGRYVEFVVYPFSFGEYLEFFKKTSNDVNVREAFDDYIRFGGMPFTLNLGLDSDAKEQYLKDIYSSIVLKDIVKRNNIRDVDLLDRFIAYVLSNVGHTFSATSLVKFLKSENRKIAHETILNYLKACTDAYLFFKVNREDMVGKKILSVSEKYYTADHSLKRAVFDSNQNDVDQILENVVCMELLRRNYHVVVGKNGNKEIDFVATRGNGKIYVQVSYMLATEDVVEREFGAYKNVQDNYPKYVVSMDRFDFSRNGIKHRSISDFLLMPEWDV